jgi:FlaA1/EpsC-like NDP-sugar epimerase
MARKFFLRSRYAAPLFEVGAVSLAIATAFLLRFEFAIPRRELPLLIGGVALAVPIKAVVFWVTGCQGLPWRYVAIGDLKRLFFGNVLASMAWGVAVLIAFGSAFPKSVYILDLLLCFLLKSGTRVAVRLYFESIATELAPNRKRVLIYGAGATGMTLLREIRSNPSLGYQVIGLLDDNPDKQSLTLMGSKVLGSGRAATWIVDRLRKRARRVDEIIIAMPSAKGSRMREAIANCRAAGVPCKTIPGVGDLLSGKVLSSQIREVSVEDLLGREPVRLDESNIRGMFEARSVMVTGGAGSIGSELCRQVACLRPSRLVIFERAESDLFRIHRELVERHPELQIVPQIGDIREADVVDAAIREHGVEVILHAAAYKHVPMMESHLREAVKNNILGTHTLAQAARKNHVTDFLMISSDKAVNPTNIMGLTKRVAELIVSADPPPGDLKSTKFVSVRFGNVLGSNGSVVPLFREQIALGGPLTVTHPEMRRYFMTIREAVQLVLQASTMGKGSEIFVLDMGEPVRIVDLARNMIRLSGREPDLDVEIRYTGLRPGEKLYEELIIEGENIVPTYHDKVRIFRGPTKSTAVVERWLARLQALLERDDESAIIEHLKGFVPEYQPAGRWRKPLKTQPGRLQKAATS